MVTEGGDSEIGGIPEQLQNAVDTSGRTDIAQGQLAKILGGQPEVSIKLDDFGMGPRRYDAWASPNTGAELKFGNDPLVPAELNKDIILTEMGGTLVRSGESVDQVNVEYHFVSDPITGEHVSANALTRLDQIGIPYHVWGPEFWEY